MRALHGRTAPKAAFALIGAIALVAFLAQEARSAYNPIDRGTTKLVLDKRFLALLRGHDVGISVKAGAEKKGRAIVFPVAGGRFDPADAKGTVEHGGSLVLAAKSRRVLLRALTLKTTRKGAPFSFKVGGGQLKLAQAGKIEVGRHGFGSKIKVSSLALSAKVATRLEKRLQLRGIFEPGEPLGYSVTVAEPATVALAGVGRASFELDPSFDAKLQELFVAVNPVFPAEHPGPFSLPIFGGALAPEASGGSVAMQGALEFLQLGGGQVFWRDPTLDFTAPSLGAEVEVDPSPPYGGKLGPVPIAAAPLGTVSANPKPRTISVAASLYLGAPMAAIFNEVFASPQGKQNVFSSGEAMGSFSFTAQGR